MSFSLPRLARYLYAVFIVSNLLEDLIKVETFLNFYVQQETEGAHHLIDSHFGQLQSFSANNSVY